MDPFIVSAAKTVIESERAKRILDMYRAYSTVYEKQEIAQVTIDILLSRTSHLWMPTTKRERLQQESTKISADDLAFINAHI